MGKPRVDITGQRFGMLTAIRYDHTEKGITYWLFKCDCGCEKIIRTKNVLNGSTKSCGCKRHLDITGQRFGMLTAVRFDHTGYRNQTYWLFKCDCGNEKIIDKGEVIRGRTQSCGCSRRDDITGQKFGMLTAMRFDHTGLNKHTYYLFKCDCGCEKIIAKYKVLSGHTQSCGCALSTMEAKIKNLLIANQIPYEEQRSFEDCRDKNPLRFDFYISNLNLVIEAQGEQHYRPVDHFGGQTQLEDQQRKDQIKRDYCSANNINLLEIKYDDDLESIIEEEVIQPWNILKGDKSS